MKESYGILINTTQPAVKKNHICYKVTKKENSLELFEVTEVWYPHPDAPDNAIVPKIEFNSLGVFTEANSIHSALHLLLHADKNIQNSIRNL